MIERILKEHGLTNYTCSIQHEYLPMQVSREVLMQIQRVEPDRQFCLYGINWTLNFNGTRYRLFLAKDDGSIVEHKYEMVTPQACSCGTNFYTRASGNFYCIHCGKEATC